MRKCMRAEDRESHQRRHSGDGLPHNSFDVVEWKYPKRAVDERGHRPERSFWPPSSPDDCYILEDVCELFRRVCKAGWNRVCLRGNPDCSQCGCAISSGLHWVKCHQAGRSREDQSFRARFDQRGFIVQPAAAALDATVALDTQLAKARLQASRGFGANPALRFSVTADSAAVSSALPDSDGPSRLQPGTSTPVRRRASRAARLRPLEFVLPGQENEDWWWRLGVWFWGSR